MVRVVKCWNRLSRPGKRSPPLETFKIRLHEAPSSLIWLLKMSLLIAEGFGLNGLYQPKLFWDSMKAARHSQ